MKDSWLTTIFTGKTTSGDEISATTMNVTKVVSAFLAIAIALATGLKNVADLSTTQLVTIWLVVSGMIVIVGIVDMVCRAYVTSHAAERSSETLLGDLRLGKVKVDDEVVSARAPIEADLVGLLPGSKPLAHVHFTVNGHDFDEYVDPKLVHT